MTDVSLGFRRPCWCPSGWAPTWRLHTNLYKFREKASPHILQKKNCCDLNLGNSLCIVTFFLFSDSIEQFRFLFYGVTLKTSNSMFSTTYEVLHLNVDYSRTLPDCVLLHIMCGYQCDKAVTKNDTREVI